jgi:hypothetical protein
MMRDDVNEEQPPRHKERQEWQGLAHNVVGALWLSMFRVVTFHSLR